jgi:hypothetical protein
MNQERLGELKSLVEGPIGCSAVDCVYNENIVHTNSYCKCIRYPAGRSMLRTRLQMTNELISYCEQLREENVTLKKFCDGKWQSHAILKMINYTTEVGDVNRQCLAHFEKLQAVVDAAREINNGGLTTPELRAALSALDCEGRDD